MTTSMFGNQAFKRSVDNKKKCIKNWANIEKRKRNSHIRRSAIKFQIILLIRLYYSQFRAAWQRVCGRSTAETNKMETTVNQFSETSSKAYIECSFTTFEKKRKSRQKDIQINLNNKSLITLNENLRSCIANDTSKSHQAIGSPTQVIAETKFSEQRAFLFAANAKEKDKPFEHKLSHELRMFSSEANIYGKAINQIIRTNSYNRSNICWKSYIRTTKETWNKSISKIHPRGLNRNPLNIPYVCAS